MPTATRIRDHCLAPGRSVDAPAPGGGYRRLFPDLGPLECEDDALHALGGPGGACDAAAAAVEIRADGTGPPDPDGQEAGWVADLRAVRGPRHHRRPLTADSPRRPGQAAGRPQRRRPAGRQTCPATPRGWPWSVTPATLEFGDAAYRYGHSQVRYRYQVNRDAEPVPFLPDLLGFRPVPAALAVGWSYLFGLPGQPLRPARAAAGPAGQTDRRPPGGQPHPTPPGHHRASRRRLQHPGRRRGRLSRARPSRSPF
jgi:hypothetical protein